MPSSLTPPVQRVRVSVSASPVSAAVLATGPPSYFFGQQQGTKQQLLPAESKSGSSVAASGTTTGGGCGAGGIFTMQGDLLVSAELFDGKTQFEIVDALGVSAATSSISSASQLAPGARILFSGKVSQGTLLLSCTRELSNREHVHRQAIAQAVEARANKYGDLWRELEKRKTESAYLNDTVKQLRLEHEASPHDESKQMQYQRAVAMLQKVSERMTEVDKQLALLAHDPKTQHPVAVQATRETTTVELPPGSARCVNFLFEGRRPLVFCPIAVEDNVSESVDLAEVASAFHRPIRWSKAHKGRFGFFPFFPFLSFCCA